MREIGIRRLLTGTAIKHFKIENDYGKKPLTREGKRVPSGALGDIGRLTCAGEGNRNDL